MASQVNIAERPHLAGKEWYYGAISRAQCDALLNQAGNDGDFLIRDSETNVSLCFYKNCYHAYLLLAIIPIMLLDNIYNCVHNKLGLYCYSIVDLIFKRLLN